MVGVHCLVQVRVRACPVGVLTGTSKGVILMRAAVTLPVIPNSRGHSKIGNSGRSASQTARLSAVDGYTCVLGINVTATSFRQHRSRGVGAGLARGFHDPSVSGSHNGRGSSCCNEAAYMHTSSKIFIDSDIQLRRWLGVMLCQIVNSIKSALAAGELQRSTGSSARGSMKEQIIIFPRSILVT